MRWKTFIDFVANLFSKLYTKFYLIRSSFVGDIMRNMLVYFFGHTVERFCNCASIRVLCNRSRFVNQVVVVVAAAAAAV